MGRPSDPAAAVAARLLIHAPPADGAARAGPGVVLPWLSRLRAWLQDRHALGPAVRAGLRIEDLQGQPFFATDDPRPSIALALPAGTYHVTVHRGALQRRYTVTLEPGRTVDLQLPPAGQGAAGPSRQKQS